MSTVPSGSLLWVLLLCTEAAGQENHCHFTVEVPMGGTANGPCKVVKVRW